MSIQTPSNLIYSILVCLYTSVSLCAQTNQADTLRFPNSKGKWFMGVDSQTTTEWKVSVPYTDTWITVEKKEDASGVWITLQMNEQETERNTTITLEKEEKVLLIPLLQRGIPTMIMDHKEHYEYGYFYAMPDWGANWTVSVSPQTDWGGHVSRYGNNEGYMLYLPENTSRESRELFIQARNEEETLGITRVRQIPNPLPLSHTHYTVSGTETNVTLHASVTDSLTFRLPNWIILQASKQTTDGVDYTFRIQANEQKAFRSDSIYIEKADDSFRSTIPVAQYGHSLYTPVVDEYISDTLVQEEHPDMNLFTDLSCSALKPDVTLRKIKRCPNAFFRNLGMSMLRNEYDKEFRIQTYYAYMDPYIQAPQNGITPFSRMDNPTGIAAIAGQPLVILVEHDVPGLRLKVQNLDVKSGFDGYGGINYDLHKGMNVIHSKDGGLCYILYHSATPETALPVKIHFASGSVNGYFNLEKHTNPDGSLRWEELLSHAGGPFFDVLSPYVHFTLRTEDFRRYVSDVKQLLATYDTLICHEQEFAGLKKYKRWIKNRLYIHSTDKAMLYSSPYHIGFQDQQLPELLNPDLLKTTYCWGPAHELGHALQIRPAMMWTGMTEVTNNIQSMEIQRMWGNPSRLHTDSRITNGFADIYEQAMNVAFVEKTPFSYLTDCFDQLVPFWQLRLYVMDVCQKEDFYKDLHERSRLINDRWDLTNGQWQLEFIYNSCIAANMDLRPFFRQWGWLTPAERIYNTEEDTLTVTTQDIDRINTRIDSLQLPLQMHAAAYITDQTLHLYTDPQALRPGTAHINTITGQVLIEGATGAVAFEVYCGEKLLGVSYRTEFNVKNLSKDRTGLIVKAVAFDNQRINCELKVQ